VETTSLPTRRPSPLKESEKEDEEAIRRNIPKMCTRNEMRM